MSVQAMTWVLEQSRSEHSARLVLFSLANHAGTDGADAYPSIATIARETRLGESTVRQALDKLKALGEIVEGDISRRRTRTFRLMLDPAESAPPQDLDPRRIERETPQNLAAPPQDLAGEGAGSAPEPSLEPSSEPPREPSAARERRGMVKHKGKPIPADRLSLAEAIVEDFNIQAGTGYAARKGDDQPSGNLSRVLSALNDHPQITVDLAHRMIACQLARPYWQGRPDLGNVFGPGVVERNLEDARNPTAARPHFDRFDLAARSKHSAAEQAAALRAEADAEDAAAGIAGEVAA